MHDVLVVGAGCAGMRAAIEAHDRGARVAVISKLHPTRSHSGAAEGGINAALGNTAEDSPELHAFDTVKGSGRGLSAAPSASNTIVKHSNSIARVDTMKSPCGNVMK